jgi:hypothetical protein
MEIPTYLQRVAGQAPHTKHHCPNLWHLGKTVNLGKFAALIPVGDLENLCVDKVVDSISDLSWGAGYKVVNPSNPLLDLIHSSLELMVIVTSFEGFKLSNFNLPSYFFCIKGNTS